MKKTILAIVTIINWAFFIGFAVYGIIAFIALFLAATGYMTVYFHSFFYIYFATGFTLSIMHHFVPSWAIFKYADRLNLTNKVTTDWMTIKTDVYCFWPVLVYKWLKERNEGS